MFSLCSRAHNLAERIIYPLSSQLPRRREQGVCLGRWQHVKVTSPPKEYNVLSKWFKRNCQTRPPSFIAVLYSSDAQGSAWTVRVACNNTCSQTASYSVPSALKLCSQSQQWLFKLFVLQYDQHDSCLCMIRPHGYTVSRYCVCMPTYNLASLVSFWPI